MLDAAVVGAEAADLRDVPDAGGADRQLVLDREPDVPVGAGGDVVERVAGVELGVELGDVARGRDAADLGRALHAEIERAVLAGGDPGRVRAGGERRVGDVAVRGVEAADLLGQAALGEPQRAVGAGHDLARLLQHADRVLLDGAVGRDAADGGQQARLGEPELAVRAGGDVGRRVVHAETGRELRDAGGRGRGQGCDGRHSGERSDEVASDPPWHRIVVGRGPAGLDVSGRTLDAATVKCMGDAVAREV